MSCKTINIDLANVPPVPLQIGVAGENAFRTITFDASKWGADYPDATYTVIYRRSDGYLYPVLVNASADAIVWNPTGTDTAVSGNGQLEVRLLDGETIGKTIIMQTYVAPSLSGDESEPSTPAPDWVNDVADDADRAEAAVEHYPQIRNGYWYVWDVESSAWVNTGVKASGEGGGSAANAVLYTAQTLTDAQKEQARTNVGAGTYSKPSGGIPKSDLAAGVIPSVPQMATQTNMSDWTGGKTVDAAVLKADFQSALQDLNTVGDAVDYHASEIGNLQTAVSQKADSTDIPTKTSDLTNDSGYQTATQVQTAIAAAAELPAVTASDNGKFLRVVNGAWAAQTVPSAESNSFGGGS